MPVSYPGKKPRSVADVSQQVAAAAFSAAIFPALPGALAPIEELVRRPTREPDYKRESQASATLLQVLADSPQTFFETLAGAMLDLLDAASAGVCLVSPDEKHVVFSAVAGVWAPWAGRRISRDVGPWGDALDHREPLLFRHSEAQKTHPSRATRPPVEECLLLAFQVGGKARGFVWVASRAGRAFDGEDLRQFHALSRFTALAPQGRPALAQRKSSHREIEIKTDRRRVFDLLDSGICVVEKVAGLAGEPPGFVVVEANRAFGALAGGQDVVGKSLGQLFGDESRLWSECCDAVYLSGEPVRFEHEFVGERPAMELHVFRIAEQAPCRVAIDFQDVSKRKAAERAQRESEAFVESILTSSPDCIKVLDFEGNLLLAPGGRQQWGLEDFHPGPSGSWLDYWSGEYRDSARQAIEMAVAGKQGGFTGSFRTPLGEAKWLDVTVSPIRGTDGKVLRLLAVSRDVTQRKIGEETLRQSEQRFRALLVASSDLMCRMSPDWSQMHQIYDKTLFTDTPVADGDWLEHYVCPLDRPRLQALVTQAIRTKSLFEMEHRIRRADGAWGWMLSRAVPLLDADGKIVEWFGTGTDVTERVRAEQALRESDERYRSLFNSIDEGFAIIEMIFDEDQNPVDYRFLEVNPSFENQSGLQDATGRRVSELLPDLERSWIDFYGQVALTGTPMRIVSEIKSLGRWFDIYAARLGAPENRQVAVIFSDITQRVMSERALRQSEERFRALFDGGPIGMYACDAAGTIQEFNRNAVLVWGVEPVRGDPNNERFWSSFKLFFADGSPMPRAQSPVSAVLRGEIPAEHGVEVIVERADGSRVTTVANPVALRNVEGEIIGAINCMFDVTERSRLEHTTLEQAQALADLDRRKDEFLAMLSHELRNPLAPLSNAMQLLRLHSDEDPLRREAHGVIERQVGQLKYLVNDLLEVSRITTGSVRLRQEQVSLTDVVQRAIETVQWLITQRGHELSVSLPHDPIFLHGDAARLEQVLVNLLGNAAKYTDDAGRIWLSVEQQSHAGGVDAVLRVRDNGIGIAPELMPRIFELFTQAERSLDRSQGGLGIGLSLVQRLVELHGGTVEAFSQPGQGSEFVVRLPMPPVAASPTLPPTELAVPKALSIGRKVLVVDDNIDSVHSLAQLLKLFGHEVQVAYDGLSGLRAAEAMKPDVVLLDIGLPGLTGFEVAEELRRHPVLHQVVLVALTGYGQDTDRQLSQEAGFDHHLVKPADFAEVQKILASIGAPALA